MSSWSQSPSPSESLSIISPSTHVSQTPSKYVHVELSSLRVGDESKLHAVSSVHPNKVSSWSQSPSPSESSNWITPSTQNIQLSVSS